MIDESSARWSMEYEGDDIGWLELEYAVVHVHRFMVYLAIRDCLFRYA
jgi:hypothetical protein